LRQDTLELGGLLKKLPPFSARDPIRVPSRGGLLFKTALIFILTYAIIDFPHLFPPLDAEEAFPAAKEAIFARLLDVTAEELITRSIVIHWLFLSCYITCIYSALALVFVGLGLLPVQAWPPVYGSFKESYTIRQFWG
jgi:hypothetical protein